MSKVERMQAYIDVEVSPAQLPCAVHPLTHVHRSHSRRPHCRVAPRLRWLCTLQQVARLFDPRRHGQPRVALPSTMSSCSTRRAASGS